MFTSKIFPFPHLNGVMCGTGHGQFVLDWFVHMHSNLLAKDMIHANLYTPSQLRTLATKYNLNKPNTATIYQFGYSKQEQTFKGFAYRSEKNFQSDELGLGDFGIKPIGDRSLAENINILPDDFIKLIEDARRIDDALPIDQRVGIGGEIHFLYMTSERMSLRNVHRFPDYDVMYQEMCKEL